MTIKKPLISIITPCKNSEKYIERAIKSVLKQNFSNYEHIIVDGKSTDKTINIIGKYKHVKLISEADGNHIEAVNKGINSSKGEIISILNSDDYYEPKIFSFVSKIFKNPDITVVVGNLRIIDNQNKELKILKPAFKFEHILLPWKYVFPPNPSAYFYKKSIHDTVGLYDSSKGIPYDYEFLLRMTQRYQPTYVDKLLGNFRYDEGTLSYGNESNNLDDQIKISFDFAGNIFSSTFYKYLFHYASYLFEPPTREVVAFLRLKIALRSRIKKAFISLNNLLK